MQKITHNRLIFAALNEVMHSTYLNAKRVKGFDANLELKLRNIKAQLARQLKSDFDTIEKNGGLDIFYNLTEVLEGIVEAANRGDGKHFETLILMLKAYNEGHNKTA